MPPNSKISVFCKVSCRVVSCQVILREHDDLPESDEGIPCSVTSKFHTERIAAFGVVQTHRTCFLMRETGSDSGVRLAA